MVVEKGLHYDLDNYDYDLPEHLVAQEPLEKRESCRLLVLERKKGSLEHSHFSNISSCLKPGDVLVLNDTRVVPARLFGTKQTGGKVELLVLEPFNAPGHGDEGVHLCLMRAAKTPKPQSVVNLANGFRAEILSVLKEGKCSVRFLTSTPLQSILEQVGEVPLPPYIHRDGKHPQFDDVTYYQTVYAREAGSVAAPTAGLHFSASLLQELEELGIEIVMVTLHVGYGTFTPVRVNDIRYHSVHPEFAVLSQESAQRIATAKNQGRRVVAVGTTSVRILEWAALRQRPLAGLSGFCDLYIYPGFQFRVVDAVISNFHLPKTSLLLLVSAFAGRENILHAYREAIRENYRFFSYGDAMLIL